jgi:hypothetical protein
MIPTKRNPTQFPEHDPDRFDVFTEIKEGSKRGFQLKDGSKYFLDDDGGYRH